MVTGAEKNFTGIPRTKIRRALEAATCFKGRSKPSSGTHEPSWTGMRNTMVWVTHRYRCQQIFNVLMKPHFFNHRFRFCIKKTNHSVCWLCCNHSGTCFSIKYESDSVIEGITFVDTLNEYLLQRVQSNELVSFNKLAKDAKFPVKMSVYTAL